MAHIKAGGNSEIEDMRGLRSSNRLAELVVHQAMHPDQKSFPRAGFEDLNGRFRVLVLPGVSRWLGASPHQNRAERLGRWMHQARPSLTV